MQQINPVKALSMVQPSASLASLPTPKTSPSTLARVWILGLGAWGHKWTSSLGASPLNDDGSMTVQGSLWSAQLGGLPEGLVLEAVQFYAGRLDWPPSLAELRKRALGIPSLEEVRHHLTDTGRPFVRLVWRYLDRNQFARSDQRDAERQLRNAYDFAVERRLCGDDFPDAPVALLERTPERPYDPPELLAAMRQAQAERDGGAA